MKAVLAGRLGVAVREFGAEGSAKGPGKWGWGFVVGGSATVNGDWKERRGAADGDKVV